MAEIIDSRAEWDQPGAFPRLLTLDLTRSAQPFINMDPYQTLNGTLPASWSFPELSNLYMDGLGLWGSLPEDYTARMPLRQLVLSRNNFQGALARQQAVRGASSTGCG